MKIKTTILLLIFTVLGISNIQAQCITNNAFDDGEKLEFTGYYNWGFIWVNAGKINIDINDIKFQGKDALQIKGAARNAKAFESFFKLRDSLTTVVNKENLLAYTLDRITNEGDYSARHVYSYNYGINTITAFVTKKKKPRKPKTIPFEGCTNNIMSILYYARNIDYDNLEKGAKVPIKMLVDSEINDVEIRYKGIERVKTERGKEYLCYKITPVLPDGAMFEEGDGMNVWLTKDGNRVPVMIEAKIKVGSVKGILKKYSGLKHQDNVFGTTNGVYENER